MRLDEAYRSGCIRPSQFLRSCSEIKSGGGLPKVASGLVGVLTGLVRLYEAKSWLYQGLVRFPEVLFSLYYQVLCRPFQGCIRPSWSFNRSSTVVRGLDQVVSGPSQFL